MLTAGQVIVTEGDHKSIVSKLIRFVTGSWFTHVLLVTSENEAVEAVIPRLRRIDLTARLTELRDGARAYVVLDLPELTLDERQRIAAKGLSYVGRFYNLLACVWYGMTGWWYEDGVQHMVCSRLVTASYLKGIGRSLFETPVSGLSPRHNANLKDGYCTPADLLAYSDLRVVEEVTARVSTGEELPALTNGEGALTVS